jgi:hypothetical protein
MCIYFKTVGNFGVLYKVRYYYLINLAYSCLTRRRN